LTERKKGDIITLRRLRRTGRHFAPSSEAFCSKAFR